MLGGCSERRVGVSTFSAICGSLPRNLVRHLGTPALHGGRPDDFADCVLGDLPGISNALLAPTTPFVCCSSIHGHRRGLHHLQRVAQYDNLEIVGVLAAHAGGLRHRTVPVIAMAVDSTDGHVADPSTVDTYAHSVKIRVIQR